MLKLGPDTAKRMDRNARSVIFAARCTAGIAVGYDTLRGAARRHHRDISARTTYLKATYIFGHFRALEVQDFIAFGCTFTPLPYLTLPYLTSLTVAAIQALKDTRSLFIRPSNVAFANKTFTALLLVPLQSYSFS